MKIYLFDVDHTLEVSHGPIKLQDVAALKLAGHAVGINGNWAVAVNSIKGWQTVFSFIGPMTMPKEVFMGQISQYTPAEDYIMVGNDDRDPKWGGRGRVSMDALAAEAAGWRFISEDDFAAGIR